jgi:alcohol dehydrogenase class IV
MDFPQETLLAHKTIFRAGSAEDIPRETLAFGDRGIIVHGASLRQGRRLDAILDGFPRAARPLTVCRPGGEPALDEITGVIDSARTIGAQWIAGIGGGSVLDLAKAAAGLYNAAHKPQFYQDGGVLMEKGIPFIAVPTTAGTGSEATPNSVIINSESRTKLSIRDKSFLARTVILDSELLRGIPPGALAHAGMDAFVQAYESYISKNATWFTEQLALKSMTLVSTHIVAAFQTGGEASMSALLLGSYLGGIAFSHSRLGVIHGIAHPLGVLYDIPHGLICSVCLVPSIQINRQAMGAKYGVMSTAIGGDLLERAQGLMSALDISSPFTGKPCKEKEKIIRETLSSGSTAANPRKVVREDVEYILSGLFERKG